MNIDMQNAFIAGLATRGVLEEKRTDYSEAASVVSHTLIDVEDGYNLLAEELIGGDSSGNC